MLIFNYKFSLTGAVLLAKRMSFVSSFLLLFLTFALLTAVIRAIGGVIVEQHVRT